MGWCVEHIAIERGEMDYKEDVEIDIYNLHKEWEKQPRLYEEYASLLPEAIKTRDFCKEQLRFVKENKKRKIETIEADLDYEIRKHPEDYGYTKVTEPLIAKTILLQEQYKEVVSEIIDEEKECSDKLIEAEYEVNSLSNAVKSFETKKKGLECLGSLWVGGYYSEPKQPDRMRQALNNKYKK